jgi:hypothetical protein
VNEVAKIDRSAALKALLQPGLPAGNYADNNRSYKRGAKRRRPKSLVEHILVAIGQYRRRHTETTDEAAIEALDEAATRWRAALKDE